MREGFVRLGDVCTISGGYTPKPSQLFPEGDIPYFKVADMNRIGNEISLCYTDQFLKEARKVFPKGAIVFPKNGGAVATNKKRILAHDAVVDLNTGIAIPRERVDNQYLFYFFQGIDFKCFIKEGTLPVLRTKEIANLPFYFPSLPEQQRIVGILDQEFAKIDDLKANAEKSLQGAKDLFQATLKKELEPKEGWKSAQLKDIATIRPPKKELNALPLDLPVSFLPMEDLGIMDFDISPTQTKTLGELAGSYTYFAEGDVLLAKVTPCFENGKQGIARHLTNGIGFGSSEYIVYRPGNEISADFLYYFLATNDFHDRGKKQMHGACGLKRLAKEIAEQSIISFPDIEVQKKVAARIREEECKITNLQQNYQKTLTLCDDLKQSLLRKAFNGEL